VGFVRCFENAALSGTFLSARLNGEEGASSSKGAHKNNPDGALWLQDLWTITPITKKGDLRSTFLRWKEFLRRSGISGLPSCLIGALFRVERVHPSDDTHSLILGLLCRFLPVLGGPSFPEERKFYFLCSLEACQDSDELVLF